MSPTLAIGSILHSNNYQYRIEKVLGQGSFGITYEATPILQGELGALEAEKKVAIKEFFMSDHNIRNGNMVIGNDGDEDNICVYYKHKFLGEALALSKLNHRNIVKVLELFESNGTTYYVMEYCSGGSLDSLIKQCGGLSEADAMKYFFQIADALIYMHQNHMLHLDMKPANVVMRNIDEIAVIDFGLVKKFDNEGNPETSTTLGRGTPGYAPMEQLHSKDNDFPVTMDVYALGATLFKMLTDVRPPDSVDILNNGFPLYLFQEKNINIDIVQCIQHAMSLRRKERYQSVQEFANAIKVVYESNTSGDNELHRPTTAQEYYDKGVKLYESGQSHDAMQCFFNAASMDYVPAYCFIGYCYSHGTGVNTDYKEAIKWYKRAADKGDAISQLNLGYLYQKGLGTQPNYRMAIQYYKMAAQQGNIHAQCNLANCYMYGTKNVLDEKAAIKWYLRAAENGSAEAQYNLGICYDNGYGVEPNMREAIRWYKLAAQQGHAEAIKDLDTIIDNDTIV